MGKGCTQIGVTVIYKGRSLSIIRGSPTRPIASTTAGRTADSSSRAVFNRVVTASQSLSWPSVRAAVRRSRGCSQGRADHGHRRSIPQLPQALHGTELERPALLIPHRGNQRLCSLNIPGFPNALAASDRTPA